VNTCPVKLAHTNSFSPHTFAHFAEAGKKRTKALHLLEKRVINMITCACKALMGGERARERASERGPCTDGRRESERAREREREKRRK
jgi:hypothetical protein